MTISVYTVNWFHVIFAISICYIAICIFSTFCTVFLTKYTIYTSFWCIHYYY
nr:MAG TPA: hypothetical protein [Caudoviricetes sp.]